MAMHLRVCIASSQYRHQQQRPPPGAIPRSHVGTTRLNDVNCRAAGPCSSNSDAYQIEYDRRVRCGGTPSPNMTGVPVILAPNPCARCPSVDRGSFVFQALYNGLLVVQINVTICVFGLGLMFWTARYLFQKGCNSVFTNAVVLGQPLGDTCVDLTVIGLSEKALCGAHLAKVSRRSRASLSSRALHVCTHWHSFEVSGYEEGRVPMCVKRRVVRLVIRANPSDLCMPFHVRGCTALRDRIGMPDTLQVCNFWDSLQVQYLLWGSYCFLMSHLLFLGALIHNMHTLPELSSSQRKAKEEAIAAAQLKQSRHHEILMSTPLNEGYAIVAV
eukprot:365663-Chlamydomonas_euryale.AAC.15